MLAESIDDATRTALTEANVPVLDLDYGAVRLIRRGETFEDLFATYDFGNGRLS